MSKDFFPKKSEINPTIYAYSLIGVPEHEGLLKIGYTDRDAITRIEEQTKTAGIKTKIVLIDSAMRHNGSSFSDHDLHRYLRKKGFKNPHGEWFNCSENDIKSAIIAVRDNILNEDSRTQDFKMRPEQQEAVEKTSSYFKSFQKENPNKTPHFLWNAKMRFGKTFATYQLAKSMGWKRVLVLTFKPAVESAWEEDLTSHIDFKGWQFISKKSLSL